MNPSLIVSKKAALGEARLINPRDSFWGGIRPAVINLLPTPLGRQPSEYLKYTQDPQKVGKTKEVSVKSAHNDRDIFFRLEWEDEDPTTKPTEQYPFVDAAGVIIPFRADSPHAIMVTMGSEAYKVNAWYWRADEPDKPRNIWAQGLGTTVTTKKSALISRSVWSGGKWDVVIGRAMALSEQKEEAAQLAPGMKTLVSFAVWAGSNRERGGIKAFCPCKMELDIE